MTKVRERAEARRLRAEQGWSLRRIAGELGVSLSTVSLWVRDVPTPAPEPPDSAHVQPGSAGATALERRCSRCERLLPEASFNRHRGGRQWWCRDCFRDYYRERREHHRARSNALKRRRVIEAREHVLGHLARSSCRDCDEADPVVLEFDHLGDKRADIAVLVGRGVRLPVLEREIAKCDVVCGNCHRRRTAVRGGWRRLDLGVSRPWRLPVQERNVLHAYCHLLLTGCRDCGTIELCVLDFDHVGGKSETVMRLAHSGVSIGRLEEEISRCLVRCVNCHRRRTAAEAGYYRAAGTAGHHAEYPQGESNSRFENESLAC